MINSEGSKFQDCWCSFCGCPKGATWEKQWEDEVFPFCEDHDFTDNTGYCGQSCQLGYGCDQSC